MIVSPSSLLSITAEAANLIIAMSAGDVAARILFSLIYTMKKMSSIAIYFYLAAEYAIAAILFSYVAIPSVPASTAFPGQNTAR